MLRGITFVGIPCRNQDVSLKFYTQALGLKVVTDQPFNDSQRWIELSIPGAETGIALYTPEGHERRIGEFQSIAFWCDESLPKRLPLVGVPSMASVLVPEREAPLVELDDDLVERLLAEVGDGEEVVLGLLEQLTDGVDLRPLEAVAGALGQVEVLDRQVEVG